MRCKHWDCGWCYCKTGNSNDINGMCVTPNKCHQLIELESCAVEYITDIIAINVDSSKSGGFVTRNVMLTSVIHGETEITK